MLINLSNHPSNLWPKEQKEAAERVYGTIKDLPFPVVASDADEAAITRLADEYLDKVHELAKDTVVAVHIMGEMTFTLALVKRLQAEGIACVASTTERVATEAPDGHKESWFRFVRFRQYS